MTSWVLPDQFDGLRVVRALGRGGMGAVYLAHDVALDRPTALKLISAEEPTSALRSRFLVEARALARLQHPNVVGVYRFGEVDGRPYLAYEFVEGGSLAGVGQMPWVRALSICAQVARGMAASHERGVVHRDIKPANIMVGVDGSVKLLDFGLAVLGATGDRPAQALTLDGRVVGTPAYMAPERWLGEAPSPAADVWAWAMVFRLLLTGSHPLEGVPVSELPRELTLRDLPPCSSVLPDLPPVLSSLIDRCLSRSPERRPPSGVEVRDALEAVTALLLPAGGGSPTEGRIGLVGASFSRVAQSVELFSRRFYERLFALSPGLRPLFPLDMSSQRDKLVGALQLSVQSLRVPEVLVPLLRDLGRRHAAYGVEARHFEPVGAALLGALQEIEGSAWTPALAQAWQATWADLARPVLAGLAEARGGDTLGMLTEGGGAIARVALPTHLPLSGPSAMATPASDACAPSLPPRGATPSNGPGASRPPLSAPPRASGSSPPPSLPSPLTRFFGRTRELEELVAQVAEGVRLLTILGMGGSGKTRLALELARRLHAASLGRPVVWVALADARDHEGALSLMLRALGVKDAQGEPLDLLIETLHTRPALIFLDNVEDIADELGDSLSGVLEQCPDATCIITSQRPLHIMGELLYRLEPLPLPSADAATLEIEASDAVALLIDRIRLQRPTFRPDPTSLPQLLALARRLDGIPLALELVAVRVGKMQLSSLIERLERDLGLIEDGARNRPGRQRSLTAALRWTAERLDPELRALFSDLAVFPGEFGLEDLREVLGVPVTHEELESLIEHSLVVPVGGSEGRYRMLSTVRAYAAGLSSPERSAALQLALVEMITSMAGKWIDQLGTSEAQRSTARLEASWSTLLAVVDLATPERAAHILGRVPVFVMMTKRFADVLPRIERLFASDILPKLSSDVRVRLCRAGHRLNLVTGHADRTEAWRLQLLHCAALPLSEVIRDGLDAELGLSAMERGSYREAREIYQRLREGEQRRGNTRQEAVHVDSLSRVAFYAGDLRLANSLAVECAALVHQVADPQLAEANLRMRIGLQADLEDAEEVESLYDALVELRRASGQPERDGSMILLESMIARAKGEYERSFNLLLESGGEESDNRRQRIIFLGFLAKAALLRGDLERALVEAERSSAGHRALLRPCELPRVLWIRVRCLHLLGRAGQEEALWEAAEATLAVEGYLAARDLLEVWSLVRPGDGVTMEMYPEGWRGRVRELLEQRRAPGS